MNQQALHAFGDLLEQHANGTFGSMTISVPDLLAMVLKEGRYNLGKGKGDLVVPKNVRAKLTKSPNTGCTRLEIFQGQPFLDAGKILNTIIDVIGGKPVIPWIDLRDDLSEVVVRVEPWKDIVIPVEY